MGGWVKLWRDILDHPVWQDPKTLKVFLWCVMVARRVAQDYRGYRLQPGQFSTGRKAAGRELEIDPSSVYRAFQRLEELGCITVEANRTRTIVTVCNWSTYQGADDDSEQDPNRQRTSVEQAANTIREGKKERIKNSPSERKTADAFDDPESIAIVETWNAINGVPTIAKLTDGRRRALKARLGDSYFVANWRRGLQIVSCSEFCRGLVPPSDGRKQVWRADFDWFLKPDSLVKLLEGKYGGLGGSAGSGSTSGQSLSLTATGAKSGGLSAITAAEATDPAAFDGWIDRQLAFDRTDRSRQDLHAVRCSVVRLFRDPETAHQQLAAKLETLAAGRSLTELPRAEDQQQAARDLAELLQATKGGAA